MADGVKFACAECGEYLLPDNAWFLMPPATKGKATSKHGYTKWLCSLACIAGFGTQVP